MKKIFTLTIIVLCATTLFAQAPEKFSYQAVVRNASNALVSNAPVGVRVSILQGNASGSTVYVETQTVTTNANGLLTLEIGGGNTQQGNFDDIDWASGPYFLKTETDPNGGSNYSITSTQQLLSVPYALYAKEAGNVPTIPANVSAFTNDAGYITEQDIPVIPTVPTNVSSFINDAGYITMDSIPTIPTVPTNVSAFTNDVPYITAQDIPEIPTIPTNISAFTNDAGYITMDSIPTIPTVPTNVSAFVNDVPYLTSFTEQQVLSISNDTIFLTGGSFVKLPEGFNGDYNSLTNKPALFSGDYNDLTNTPTIPTVPTNVSAFTNDAGYLTNFTETDPTVPAWAKTANKPTYNYSEITNTPTIPTVPTQVSAFTNDAGYLTSFTETDPQFNAWDKNYNDLINKPTLFSGNYNDLTNKPTLFDGNYNSLSNKPNLATVAISGSYNDLINKPAIPTAVGELTNNVGYITAAQVPAQVNADWNATTGAAQILNKPTLFSGNYNDLTNKPTIPTVPTNVSAFTNDAGYITSEDLQQATGVPTVVSAFQNDAGYITAAQVPAQVNADWNATAGVAQILNKPTLFSGNYNDLSNKPSFATVATTGNYNDLTNKPVLFSGNYNDLTNKPTIPTVPTNVSAFNNDAGYITGYAETDPQFNAWDKDYNDLTNRPTIPIVPTNVGAFNNDVGYITTEQCLGVDICNLATLVAGLQEQIEELQSQLIELQSTIDSLSTSDTTPGETPATLPTVITGEVNDITETTAICGGEVLVDGGSDVIARGICWSTSENPIVGNNHTTNGTGIGNFTGSLTGLTVGTTYYVRAYATNDMGTAYGEMVSFTTIGSIPGSVVVDEKSCPEAPTVTDHEGNVYSTVQIWQQCWMRDNLRTTTSPSTGTYLIPVAGTSSTITGKQARWYNNDSATYAPLNYGLLYNWYAAMDTFNTIYGETSVDQDYTHILSVKHIGQRRGICPTGWHLPSDAEWLQLIQYVISQDQYLCSDSCTFVAKALATPSIWGNCTTPCSIGSGLSSNNATGFAALPAGRHGVNGYNDSGLYSYFWSSTEDASNYYAWNRWLHSKKTSIYRELASKSVGYSVRCLRNTGNDDNALTLPSITTEDATDITSTSAILNGTISNPDNVAIIAQGFQWKIINGDTYTTVNATCTTISCKLTGLTPNTSYSYRTFLTTEVGTVYGVEGTFTTLASGLDGLPCPGVATLTDIDGNTYNTVQIGSQCWMKENLRTTHYADGAAISLGTTTSTNTAYRYDNTSSSISFAQRGYLYNWPAVMNGASSSSLNPSGVQGICPTGWHVPSDAEWTVLTDYVKTQNDYVCGTNANYIAKALAATTGWTNSITTCAVGNTPSSNNATGFGALPVGRYYYNYGYSGDAAFFWSATDVSGNNAWNRQMYYYDCSAGGHYNIGKDLGFSVRCIRD